MKDTTNKSNVPPGEPAKQSAQIPEYRPERAVIMNDVLPPANKSPRKGSNERLIELIDEYALETYAEKLAEITAKEGQNKETLLLAKIVNTDNSRRAQGQAAVFVLALWQAEEWAKAQGWLGEFYDDLLVDQEIILSGKGKAVTRGGKLFEDARLQLISLYSRRAKVEINGRAQNHE